jgi:adenine deaminase
LRVSSIKEMISCARGEIPADLIIQNGTLINVITREMYKADIAIFKDRIVNIAEPGILDSKNSYNKLNADGKFVSPGLIESHLHIESSMLSPTEFSQVVIPRGTTTVLLDPHEIGNVLGVQGLHFLLKQTENLPLRFLIEIPSCVPAAPGLETSAAIIDSKAIEDLITKEPRFFGLGEVMNYPGVLFKDEEVLKKVELGKKLNLIDGHSPGVSGRDLDAYLTTGIESDHEITSEEEFLEKIRKGVKVMAREGSLTKDLRKILKAIKKTPLDLRNVLMASDDRNVNDLCTIGHLDHQLRIAVEEGISPVLALQMATINPASYFGLDNDIGCIAPGRIADIIILEDLESFKINSVIFGGSIVYKNNELLWNFSREEFPSWTVDTVKLKQSVNPDALRAKSVLSEGTYPVRVIGVKPHSVITESLIENLIVKNGWIQPKSEKDILSLAVIERHGVNGNIANAFVKGLGISSSPFAMATTVAHDCHNIAVAGTDSQSMVTAVEILQEIKGGYVVTTENQVLKVPLAYAGLMSTEPFKVLNKRLIEMKNLFSHLTEFDEPLMALSFIALPVIPHLKLTDKGLVDVDNFTFTELIVK